MQVDPGSIFESSFTGKELVENEGNKIRLLELIRKEESVAIIGAGSSILAGYPSWDGLLESLRKKFAQKLPTQPVEHLNEYL